MVILKKLGSRPHSRPSAEIRLVVDGHYGTEFGAAKPDCAYLFAQSLANGMKALLHAGAEGRRNRATIAISVDARMKGESVFAGGFSDADTRPYRRSPTHPSKYSVRNASAPCLHSAVSPGKEMRWLEGDSYDCRLHPHLSPSVRAAVTNPLPTTRNST